MTPLVASMLYTAPWHILPAAHGELGQLYHKYLNDGLGGREAREREGHGIPGCADGAHRVSSGVSWAYDTDQGLAIIWVEGIIAKRSPELLSGPPVVDLAKLDVVLQEVGQLEGIEVVLIDFNTPGGCCIGLPETAQNIQELAQDKRVIGYADFQCCSAGMYLAGACDEFYAAESACVGSIGTYIAALDSSRWFEMNGLKLKLFRKGELKAIGLEGKVWTEEEEKFMQEQVDHHGEEFRQWMRDTRPGIEDSTMEGQWFFGGDAPAGMHDGIFRDLASLVAAVMEEREEFDGAGI